MSETDKKVSCNLHGSTNATFLCQHLLSEEQIGFNQGFDPENPDDLYPDAWCDKCDQVLETEGEWNDAAAKYANIKIVCALCYENIREKNWIQDDEKYHKLIKSSFSYLQAKQERFLEKYKVDEHDRWDWDQGTGKLIFTDAGIPQVEADFHFSGSFSTSSNTWMWAWANESLDEKVKASSRELKSLGEELGLKQLAAGRWPADEFDGWEVTSLLAQKLNAIGAYRTSGDGGFTYLVVTKARWLKV